MRGPIYKYPLGTGETEVPGGRILKIGFQANAPFAWVEVDINQANRTLVCVPTGLTPPERSTYVDSAISDHLVWHYYELHA